MAAHRSGPPRGRRPAQGEPVIARALRLLDAFQEPQEALSLTSLAARARLSKSTALRLARHLLDWGALERTDGGQFVIGLRLLEVASLAPRGHGLRAAAMPFLEDLHHATGQHVLLAVRDGAEAVLVERLSAHRAGRAAYHVGGRLPLHSTGVGLILLAFAPLDVRERVLEGPLTIEPGAPRVGPDELRRRIAAIRREGTATNTRELPEPMSSVAAPVTGPDGSVVAALSVLAPTGTFDPATARPAVVAVSRAVSRAIRARS
ncbi:DNA-binding IclR family transcriptional regulator [Pseudonocardia eucalypti]|uniref:IclR family transcriptional regulator domain-containing protein n=1 Tax=Pseudonocardia eucalypti TaxID=648755 RepID=UPI00160A94E3|nr:DNA-binding IclR family transcriptional regulator [Pseudonocardia eucalypti]